MSAQQITLDNVRNATACVGYDDYADVVVELSHAWRGERIEVTAEMTFETAVVLWAQLGEAIRAHQH
jgi:hypothetical protein